MRKESSPIKWIIASLISAGLGLVTTAILTAQHYRIADQGLLRKSFCTISHLIDCDTALTSRYAHTFNIPNTELGFLFYLVIAICAFWALISEERRQSLFSFILAASSLALVYAIYMAYLLVAKLSILCIFCVASHILTLAIFLIALKVRAIKLWKLPQFYASYLVNSFRQPAEAARKTYLMRYVIMTVVVYGVGLLFFFGLNDAAHSGEAPFNKEALLNHFYRQEPITIDVPDRPSWGRPDAPITIVEFSDFQCPFCKQAAFSLKPYLGEYRDDIRIVFINYPLDSTCNPNVEQAVHPAACIAAKAALCAFQQGGNATFWKMHDEIFAEQRRLSQTLIVDQLAPQSGLDSEQMKQCLVSPVTATLLSEDIETGQKTGIGGTPSVYINGRFLRGWNRPEILRTIIEAELDRTKKQ